MALDGKMIDPPIAARARKLLARRGHRRAGTEGGGELLRGDDSDRQHDVSITTDSGARRARASRRPRDAGISGQADAIWSEDQRLDFIAWIAANPDAGEVIKGANGARKVRWTRPGSGKGSGVRAIYFRLVDDEVVLLLMLYAKASRGAVGAKDLKRRQSKI